MNVKRGSASNEPRINNEITGEKVRLVGSDGGMLGVVSLQEAMNLADEEGMDLVEISPHAAPPVCKVLDYGKFRYEAQKKQKEARKNQKVVHIKEVKLRLNVGDHDYQVKLRSARRFIDSEDKVKFSLRFRGREMAHADLGHALLKRVIGDMEDVAKVEVFPKMEGRQLVMILTPQ